MVGLVAGIRRDMRLHHSFGFAVVRIIRQGWPQGRAETYACITCFILSLSVLYVW